MTRQDTEREAGTVASAGAGGERGRGFRALGHSVSRIAKPIAAKRGGGTLARLKAEWSAVVGAELAGICWPEALGRDGALKLRCAPGFALDLQHCTPLIIERINLFGGPAAVTRVLLVQGPLPFVPARRIAAPPRPLSAPEAGALDQQLQTIDDPQLRDALGRLGRSLLTRDRGRD